MLHRSRLALAILGAPWTPSPPAAQVGDPRRPVFHAGHIDDGRVFARPERRDTGSKIFNLKSKILDFKL
jgi:hypothetical protein